MIKHIKNYIFFLILLIEIFFFAQKISASQSINFFSLKNNEANVRVGPSKKHPIKFIYNKKYLPLEVLDKSETWIKIKDYDNNSGWIHVSQLSKKKTALNIKNNSVLYKKATIYSKPIAKLESGRLVLIKKCKIKWCKITSGAFSGWISKNSLWGKIN